MLSGQEKTAILLMSLDPIVARGIMNSLDEDEMRQILRTMVNLGAVESDTVERVIIEFIEEVSGTLGFVSNSKTAEQFLRKTVEVERFSTLINDMKSWHKSDNLWENLLQVNDNVIANFLRDEYPQTSALILCKMQPAKSARILEMLNKDYAFEVIKRMLNMENVKEEAVRTLENILQTSLDSGKYGITDANKFVADVFNNFSTKHSNEYMQMLYSYNLEKAQDVRKFMFTFNDIVNIDVIGMQNLIKAINKQDLIVALKGISENVFSAFVKGMSQRSARLVTEEIQSLGDNNTNQKDIEKARTNILNIAKNMLAAGTIKFVEEHE